MDVTNVILCVPDSIKAAIVDFTEKIHRPSGKYVLRVTLDRLLTEAEQQLLMEEKRVCAIGIANKKSSPEKKYSVFYIFE